MIQLSSETQLAKDDLSPLRKHLDDVDIQDIVSLINEVPHCDSPYNLFDDFDMGGGAHKTAFFNDKYCIKFAYGDYIEGEEDIYVASRDTAVGALLVPSVFLNFSPSLTFLTRQYNIYDFKQAVIQPLVIPFIKTGIEGFAEKESCPYPDFLREIRGLECERGVAAQWSYDVIARYGAAFFLELIKDLTAFRLNDLHDENIGYLGECPVILDWDLNIYT